MSAHCDKCGSDLVYGTGEDWQLMRCVLCECVAERDALAARLAEAEAQVSGWAQLHGDEHERAEAAEALRNAANLDEMNATEVWPFSVRMHVTTVGRLARAVLSAADRPTEGGEMDTTPATHDALMEAWGIIANVSEGDWTKQTQEWQDAAVRWRDETFHPAIRAAAERGNVLADRLAAADRPEETTP